MRPQASSELMLLECSVDEEGVDHHGLDEGLEAICVAMFGIVEEGNPRCKTKGSAIACSDRAKERAIENGMAEWRESSGWGSCGNGGAPDGLRHTARIVL